MVEKAEHMVVGDPMASDVTMLISYASGARSDYVQIGVDEGAIATGGTQIHPQGFENGMRLPS